MRRGGALRLARHNLARSMRPSLFSALGVAMGTGALVVFVALGAGVGELVRTRILPVDDAALEVVAPQVSFGNLFGAEATLDDAALERLRALAGVRAAHPKMDVRIGAVSRYDGNFFGQRLRMGLEVMAVGVAPELVAHDVAEGRSFKDSGDDDPIPVVVNTKLLDIYNTTFARKRGLPTLSASMLTGFQFPVEWGRSFVKASGGRVESGRLELVGFSPHALLAGVTMPLDAARRLNRAYGLDDTTYSAVTVLTTGPEALSAVASEVRRLGFDIDDTDRETAEQAAFAIAVVTAAFSLLALLVTALAAINIGHAFWAQVRERRREIGVLRALGASQSDVMSVLMTEAILVGGAGSLLGIVGGRICAFVIDALAARVLPPFPFKPESFFAFSPTLVMVAFAVGLAAAVIGAFGPARGAANLDPVQALAD